MTTTISGMVNLALPNVDSTCRQFSLLSEVDDIQQEVALRLWKRLCARTNERSNERYVRRTAKLEAKKCCLQILGRRRKENTVSTDEFPSRWLDNLARRLFHDN